MTHKLFTLGEVLKDVHLTGLSKEEIREINQSDFADLIKSGKVCGAYDGGAPANVAAYFCLLGGETKMLLKVGKDDWGKELTNNFESYGVSIKKDVGNGTFSDAALIHNDDEGNHDFVKFLWGSLPLLKEGDVSELDIKNSEITHIGSITSNLFKNPKRSLDRAIELSKKHNVPVSFDPNVRKAVYNDMDHARREVKGLVKRANIIKLSGAEFFLMNEINTVPRFEDIEREGRKTAEHYPGKVFLITLGEVGALGFFHNEFLWASSYNFGKIKNTIGAGDAFMAASLQEYLKRGSLKSILDYSCKMAGISVTSEKTIDERVKEGGGLQGEKKYKNLKDFENACNAQLEKEFKAYLDLKS